MTLLPCPQYPGVVQDALADVGDGPHHFPHNSSMSSVETVPPPAPALGVWILKVYIRLSLSFLSADNLYYLKLCLDADGVGEAVHGAPGHGTRVLQVNALQSLGILL